MVPWGHQLMQHTYNFMFKNHVCGCKLVSFLAQLYENIAHDSACRTEDKNLEVKSHGLIEAKSIRFS